jgi:sortase B
MLSAIIYKKTGKHLSEYLAERLFEPLGIADYAWEKCPMGIEKGGWGLYMRPEDMGKIGTLVMNGGVWGGKRIISEEYLKKSTVSGHILTPAEILAGKTDDGNGENTVFSEEQETLVGKIGQLKKINPDTVGWITIEGTVVNYPMVWSSTEDYYLRRDFYGKKLTSGTIFLDERNSPDITQNRNTVIYGHNMSDGSMFASVHDFASSTVFYGTKIEIATEKGIFIYTPFSVHESNAFDNYFETDFVSDEDFLNFCEQMAFISIYETDTKFTKESQLITLSTCMKDPTSKEQRFAVHAVLTQVIR